MLYTMMNRSFECAGQDPRNVNFDPEFPVIANAVQQNNLEEDLYFYHTDHLGSSSWITYTDGSVTQHLQNLPFGEPFIDQRATSYDIRYKFTGKEMDTETGYQYFGARYYNSDISVWLSVDPLSFEYPSTSPYAYVENNPLMFVDPNGMFKDPTDAKKSHEEATLIFGEDRVGDIYNANEGTDKEDNFKYNIYREGEDKNIHKTVDGGEYQYTPDDIISSDNEFEMYSYRDAYNKYMSNPDEVLKEKKEILKKQMVLNLEIRKRQELIINERQRIREVKVYEAKKLLWKIAWTLAGNYINQNIDATPVVNSYYPKSMIKTIDKKYACKAKSIISKYDAQINEINGE